MKTLIVFSILIVFGCNRMFAVEELPNWDQLPSGNRFVEFVVSNKPLIVNLTNVNSLASSRILGLEVIDADPADWSALGAKLTNVICLKVKTGERDLPEELFSAIINFKRLAYLHLECRNALLIPSHVSLFTNLQCLTYLGIDAPIATNIHDGIYQLMTLKELNLVAGMVDIPDGISKLSALDNLVIFGKRKSPLKRLPSDLQYSRVSRMEFGIVPGLGELLTSLPPKLIELQAIRCGLKSIPRGWLEQTNLTAINLNGNALTEFPVELLSIRSLKLIQLELNAITNVPPIRVEAERKLKISLVANPIQHFAQENNPLVKRGIIIKYP